MISVFVKHVRGPIVAILAFCAIAFGAFLFGLLPLWGDLQLAAGGRELQETPFFSPARALEVLSSYDAQLRATARIFYGLDSIFVLLLTLALATLIGFSLRRLRRGETFLRWLVILPLAAGLFDFVENALLWWMLQNNGADPFPLIAGLVPTMAGIGTGLKLIFGAAAMACALALLFIAGMLNVRRQLEDPAQ